MPIETPKTKPLTQEQIASLPTKTRVIVQWTEDRAPTTYLVERGQDLAGRDVVHAVVSYGEEGGIWSRSGAGRLTDAFKVWREGAGDPDDWSGWRVTPTGGADK